MGARRHPHSFQGALQFQHRHLDEEAQQADMPAFSCRSSSELCWQSHPLLRLHEHAEEDLLPKAPSPLGSADGQWRRCHASPENGIHDDCRQFSDATSLQYEGRKAISGVFQVQSDSNWSRSLSRISSSVARMVPRSFT